MLYRTRFRLAIVVLGACLVGGGLYSQKRLAALTAEKTEVSQLAELKKQRDAIVRGRGEWRRLLRTHLRQGEPAPPPGSSAGLDERGCRLDAGRDGSPAPPLESRGLFGNPLVQAAVRLREGRPQGHCTNDLLDFSGRAAFSFD